MTLELNCTDVFDGCPGVVHGETQDEVLDLAAAHAADAHGVTAIDEGTKQVLVGAIHPA